MKYLKAFNTHDDYLTYIVGSEFKNLKYDSVNYCVQQNDVHFDKYIPSYNLLDILYANANGEKKVDSTILDPSLGYIPIGLCVASTGFFGENEKARWMSLKYMNCTTPETGSLTKEYIYWGNGGTDIPTIINIPTTIQPQPNREHTYYLYGGQMNVDYYDNSSSENKLPSVLTEDNTWNISVLGAINTYAMTDIDGKNKTNQILAIATAQSTWQTDTSINNQSGANYAPAACCCARYHTLGTQAGDWYLGACGEMCMILAKKTDIDIKLAAISALYSNDCMSSFNETNYFSSTESDANNIYYVSASDAFITYTYKTNSNSIIAMLQY